MIDWLLNNDFLLRAGLAGICISLIAGPLGSTMIWRRMVYFGDTLAHSTLLGIALAVMLQVNMYFGLIGICVLISIALLSLSRNLQFANDTILSVLSNTILAIGLILATKIENVRLDLLGYFYGDILAIEPNDIYLILGVVAFTLIVLIKLWRWLLLITLHEDLARVEGVPVVKVKLAFVFIMALVFAITMRLLGILLMVALFVIPAASARRFAKTPEAMAILGSVCSLISVVVGLGLSSYYDWPTGPAIVVTAAMIFLGSLVKR